LAAGFLAQVNYSLFVDDVDWNVVRSASRKGYSVKELNERLFLPQRDEAVVEHLLNVWSSVHDPRAIVFCQTIDHAERMRELLAHASPHWRNARCIHSDQSRRERQLIMADFRAGRVGLLTVRDIFNEGVDVPDVNIIAFLRVTHSRRIFIQQLGRGLRIRKGKDFVHVLDFTTDIRRIAATLLLSRELRALSTARETVVSPQLSTVRFTNENIGRLMDAWIIDAANLETAADEAKLQFPDVPFDIS
jgi:superfamily II DNA or RNA helicase